MIKLNLYYNLPLPIHRTTIAESEIHHTSSRNSDRQVQRDRKDFLGNIKLPDMIQAIDHL